MANAVIKPGALQDDRVRMLGNDHPKVLRIRNNMAICHAHAGRSEEAITQLTLVLESRSRLLGTNHPDCEYSLSSRAEVVLGCGAG